MQLFDTKVLDLLEVALDDLHAKYFNVLCNSTVHDYNKPTYLDMKEKLALCESTRHKIHEDNKRLKYQQLRTTIKTDEV